MKPDEIKIAQIGLIALLVTGITILHYRTGAMHITSHILLRELYFLPIILVGERDQLQDQHTTGNGLPWRQRQEHGKIGCVRQQGNG